MDNNISRRQFIKFTGGSLAAASVLLSEQDCYQFTPQKLLVDISQNYSTAKEVTHSFVRAKGPFLMATFSIFYPNFLLRRGRQAISELKKAALEEKSIYTSNHTRLDALPAVASAHLLPTTVFDEDKSFLCGEIALALKDPRREVKETVILNLIAATSPNPDSLSFFSVDAQVLQQIEILIIEAEQNEKLLSPLSLCTEFLLNARSLLYARDVDKKAIEPYERLISMLKESTADHFCYIAKLIRIHDLTFFPISHKVNSLLPHATEALIGWKNFGYARDYLSHLALIRAKLAHQCFSVVTGELASDCILTSSEASAALPKLITFFRDFELCDLIDFNEIQSKANLKDNSFQIFLKNGDFNELIQNPKGMGFHIGHVQPHQQEIELRNLVPFSQYNNYYILQKMANIEKIQGRRFFQKAITTGLISAIIGEGSVSVFSALARVFKLNANHVTQNRKQQTSELDIIYNEIEKIEVSVDNGDYEGVDLQQKEIGSLNVFLKGGNLTMSMTNSNNPNLNFHGPVGAVNSQSTVHSQVGIQHNYSQDGNLVEAIDEIQAIFQRLTQNTPSPTEMEKQMIVEEAVEKVQTSQKLTKRLKAGGKVFVSEALQKVSDQWWVSPFLKAIEAIFS